MYEDSLDRMMTKKATRVGDTLVLQEVLSSKMLKTLVAMGWELLDQIAHAPMGGTSLFTLYTLRKRLDTAA